MTDREQTFDESFPRGWKRLRNNWAQSWSLGRFEFEIEWVPKACSYMFTFSINTPRKVAEKRGY